MALAGSICSRRWDRTAGRDTAAAVTLSHPLCKVKPLCAEPTLALTSTQNTSQKPLLSPKVAMQKPLFLGKPHHKQPCRLPHLLQAAALPGGDLRVGPERLAKLLNAARRHRDLPLRHQNVLQRDSRQAASATNLSPPALPAPTWLQDNAVLSKLSTAGEAARRRWHHNAGDNTNMKWLLPSWAGCLYNEDGTNRRCSIPR